MAAEVEQGMRAITMYIPSADEKELIRTFNLPWSEETLVTIVDALQPKETFSTLRAVAQIIGQYQVNIKVVYPAAPKKIILTRKLQKLSKAAKSLAKCLKILDGIERGYLTEHIKYHPDALKSYSPQRRISLIQEASSDLYQATEKTLNILKQTHGNADQAFAACLKNLLDIFELSTGKKARRSNSTKTQLPNETPLMRFLMASLQGQLAITDTRIDSAMRRIDRQPNNFSQLSPYLAGLAGLGDNGLKIPKSK